MTKVTFLLLLCNSPQQERGSFTGLLTSWIKEGGVWGFKLTYYRWFFLKITITPETYFCINTVTVVFAIRNCIFPSRLVLKYRIPSIFHSNHRITAQNIGKYRISSYHTPPGKGLFDKCIYCMGFLRYTTLFCKIQFFFNLQYAMGSQDLSIKAIVLIREVLFL